MGYVDGEGVLSTIFTTGGAPIHKNFEDMVLQTFNIGRRNEKSRRIAQKIKEYYYGDKNQSLETLDIYIKVGRKTK